MQPFRVPDPSGVFVSIDPHSIMDNSAGCPPVVIDVESSDSESCEEVEQLRWPTVSPNTEMLMELFSPPRLTVVHKAVYNGLGASMDLSTGWDAMNWSDRAASWNWQTSVKPRYVMCSPPCTMFSSMMRTNKSRMCPLEWDTRMNDALIHMRYSVDTCKLQVDNGCFFAHEHPVDASSWQLPEIDVLRQLPNVGEVVFDQCRLGLRSPSGEPLRKRTRIMTNAPGIVANLVNMQCNCPRGSHVTISGCQLGITISKFSQRYPPAFVRALVDGFHASW